MKRNIFLSFCCFTLLFFTACSNDYEDATSKHVYGENENPYLKLNTAAQVEFEQSLNIRKATSITVNLADYASLFEEQMGMSVDAVVSGLESGETVFYPIDVTKNEWLKTVYNAGTGWYFNSANQPCTADDADSRATVSLDAAARTLTFALTENGQTSGLALEVNVGFAVNGPDYDDYTRFTFTVSVNDPALVIRDEYLQYAGTADAELADYASNISEIFGMTVDQFIAAINSGDVLFSLADPATGEWVEKGTALIYYAGLDGAVVDAVNYATSAEYNKDLQTLVFSYNETLAVDTYGQISAGFVSANDETQSIRFLINYTIGPLGR